MKIVIEQGRRVHFLNVPVVIECVPDTHRKIGRHLSQNGLVQPQKGIRQPVVYIRPGVPAKPIIVRRVIEVTPVAQHVIAVPFRPDVGHHRNDNLFVLGVLGR